MNKIVIGNLKMNLIAQDLEGYIANLANIVPGNMVIMCPSTLFIPYFEPSNYKIGAQNLYLSNNNYITGETSSKQLASMGVEYCIIGHSERRAVFKENDDLINEKIKDAIKQGIIPIVCIGETMEENAKHETYSVLMKQLAGALKGIQDEQVKGMIIAYEPVYAIGTNQPPKKEHVAQVMPFIKDFVSKERKFKFKVVYGGSINSNNVNEFKNIADLDGFLVGAACVDSNEFVKIVNML